MQLAERHRAPAAGRSEVVFGAARYVLAAAMATALFAAAPAQAEDPRAVGERIAASFDIPVQDAELEALLAYRAEKRRSKEKGIAVAVLPYTGMAMTMTDARAAFRTLDRTGVLGAPLTENRIVEARLPRPRPEDAPIVTGSIETSVDTGSAAASDPSESEAAFLQRFAGSFTGSGQVQRNASERPNNVKCELTGQPTTAGVSISGKCSVFVISREIQADIHYDPASGRYNGTYVGSKVGPAKLSGTRQGDSVVLAITWPKPVNGDTDATMTIRNSGNGELAITVSDRLTPGGPKADVTQMALAR